MEDSNYDGEAWLRDLKRITSDIVKSAGGKWRTQPIKKPIVKGSTKGKGQRRKRDVDVVREDEEVTEMPVKKVHLDSKETLKATSVASPNYRSLAVEVSSLETDMEELQEIGEAMACEDALNAVKKIKGWVKAANTVQERQIQEVMALNEIKPMTRQSQDEDSRLFKVAIGDFYMLWMKKWIPAIAKTDPALFKVVVAIAECVADNDAENADFQKMPIAGW
jgi:hypothetical protein